MRFYFQRSENSEKYSKLYVDSIHEFTVSHAKEYKKEDHDVYETFENLLKKLKLALRIEPIRYLRNILFNL